jgi:hypothetical protein
VYCIVLDVFRRIDSQRTERTHHVIDCGVNGSLSLFST